LLLYFHYFYTLPLENLLPLQQYILLESA
jgi:hypothetical protein